jgi:hypothetical protein
MKTQKPNLVDVVDDGNNTQIGMYHYHAIVFPDGYMESYRK